MLFNDQSSTIFIKFESMLSIKSIASLCIEAQTDGVSGCAKYSHRKWTLREFDIGNISMENSIEHFLKIFILQTFKNGGNLCTFSTAFSRNQIYSEPFKMAHSFWANQFKACGFLLFHFHFVFRKCVVHFFVRSFKEVSQKQARNPDMKQLTYSKISRNAGRHH